MSNLLSTLSASAGALDSYSQLLQVTQNNVANASTPGYAKQSQRLVALDFDPSQGLVGGVEAGKVMSSRDEFAEQAVREQTVQLGAAQQNVNSLTSLQSLFDVTGQSGISSALNNLYQSFSAWGQSPTSTVARQNVIQQATDLANTFQQAATGLAKVTQDTETQLSQNVTQVNTLLGELHSENLQILNGAGSDAGLDAEVHSHLEDLSQYVPLTATKEADGTMTVLLNGQTPLLVADKEFNISYQLQTTDSSAPAHAQILAYDGTDITSQVTDGQLGALVNIRNTVLPSYMGDASQQGSLNILAQGFADRVNHLLTSGNITDASADGTTPAVTGVPLFTYDTTNSTNVAKTLAVNSSITPDQLAAIQPANPGSAGPPVVPATAEVANGVPLALSQLASPQNAADEIDGNSYSEYFGNMAANIGTQLNNANNQLAVQQAAVAQAQNLRQQASGVSLDEEAASLIQFQRAYEANSKMITVLDQLTLDTINILTT